MGGPFDFVGDIAKAVGLEQQGRSQAKAAAAYQQAQQQRINSLDWEPEYASQHAPTYQRSQSPVARAYLESMLTGSNPDTTPTTQHNAPGIQQEAAQRFGNTYGSWGALQAKQAQLDADTPWKVTPITRKVKDQAVVNAVGPRGQYTAIGFTPEESDRLNKEGVKVVNGKVLQGFSSWSPDQYRQIMRGQDGW